MKKALRECVVHMFFIVVFAVYLPLLFGAPLFLATKHQIPWWAAVLWYVPALLIPLVDEVFDRLMEWDRADG